MSKIDLNNVTSGFNVSTINANFQKIEDALNYSVLYRDPPIGEPNTMQDNLDMNGKRIYNLTKPLNNSEPVRLIDLKEAVFAGGGGSTDASDINIEDLGGFYLSTNVENALQEIGADIVALQSGGGGGGSGSFNGIDVTAAPYNADPSGTVASDTAIAAAVAAAPDGGMLVLKAGATFKIGSVDFSGKKLTIWADGAKIICTSSSGAVRKTDHGKLLRVIGGQWIGQDGALPFAFAAASPLGDSDVDFAIVDAEISSFNNYCISLIGCRETLFKGLKLTTDPASTVSACGGVYAREANNPYFSQCVFAGRGKGYGFFADGQGSPNSANPILDSCVIMGYKDNVRIVGNDDFHIVNCTIDYGVSSNTVLSSQDSGKILGGYLGGGINGVSNNPALILTSEGGLGYGPDQCRHILIQGVNFAGHQETGNLFDQVVLDGPSSAFYPTYITINGCSFLGYSRYGIRFSTISQLTITNNLFQSIGAAPEPTCSPIYNATGTGDSLVLIAHNQFPNPTTLSGSNLQSANIRDNPGFMGTNGANTTISQLNGFTGVGGFGTSYLHYVDTKGPEQWDRYGGVPTRRLRRASGTKASPGAVNSGDVCASLIADAYNGTAFNNISSIQQAADGAQTVSSSPGRIILATTPSGSTSMVSRAEVDSSGNIFINPTGLSSAGRIYFNGSTAGTSLMGIFYGTGSPEGVVSANPGSLFLSSSGEHYKKASGTGNTGWVAQSSSAPVFVHATSSVQQTCTGSNGETTLQFATEIQDTANAWATDTFTAPSAGYYSVHARMYTVQFVWTQDTRAELRIFVNGTIARRGMSNPTQVASNTGFQCSTVDADLSLNAGDTVQIKAFNSSGSNYLTNGSANDNYLTILKR